MNKPRYIVIQFEGVCLDYPKDMPIPQKDSTISFYYGGEHVRGKVNNIQYTIWKDRKIN